MMATNGDGVVQVVLLIGTGGGGGGVDIG